MTITTAQQLLVDRVMQLDTLTWGSGRYAEYSMTEKLSHAVRVMSTYTNTTPPSVADGLVIGSAEADDLVSSCRLLDDLSHGARDVIFGPLARDRQQWISTSRHIHDRVQASAPPDPQRFAAPARGLGDPTVRPHNFGFYTSTAFQPQSASMWKLYLDPYKGSDLFPAPWHIWHLEADKDAKVMEIDTARDWVNLIDSYPVVRNGLVYPDWSGAAADLDGIHFTFRGIVATQSLRIETQYGRADTPFWDVEQTLWLHWRFSTITHRERIN